KNEKHGDQVELDGKSLPCIADRGHSALVRRHLSPRRPPPPYQPGQQHHATGDKTHYNHMDQQWQVIDEVIVGHKGAIYNSRNTLLKRSRLDFTCDSVKLSFACGKLIWKKLIRKTRFKTLLRDFNSSPIGIA